MTRPTHFATADSVEAWDAEFRWREADGLRDYTVDDTWWRVAEWAAAAEGTQAALWANRFVAAFSRWRMLPDEQILKTLGVGAAPAFVSQPAAVLNVAAFVAKVPGGVPQFDRDSFVAIAALTVRFLEDVACRSGVAVRRLRIGLIGLADALHALGLGHAGCDFRHQAAQIARALAEGCVRGSVDLAEERGSRLSEVECAARAIEMRRRRMPFWLVERVLRVGLCHERLTAIDRHPLLARLANGVADAIDPLPGGSAAPGADDPVDEKALRDEMQPWIDESILFPPDEEASP